MTHDGDRPLGDANAPLAARAVKGAAWSGISTIVLRLGSVIVGIVIARLLTPEQFGVYAIALTVQGVLMTVADLGLSADLIRSKDPERIAPTVATMGAVSGATLTMLTVAASVPLAELLGSVDAAGAIAVLSCTLFLGGASVVPYGYLMRRFQQRELFVISSIDFVISTALSLALIGAGFGVMGLAIGRLAAQLVSSTLQFVFARVVPRFGLARKELKAVLAFGLPVAGANLLGWVLLNVDKIIIARLIGPIALGYYVLAFNVANWPMSALAQVVRSSILPFAARTPNSGSVLPRMTAVVWAAALPAGVTLAALSEPLILVVYGQKWAPAAPVLAALGVYGSLRVAFDIFAGYLYARGQSRPVMWLQLVSLIALVGGMLAVTPQLGILAAAWAQVVVTVAIVLPGYLWVLRSTGVSLAAMVRECLIPTLASLPAAGAAYFCATFIDNAPVALLVGGFVAVAVYALIAGRWLLAQLKALRAGPALVQEPSLERERTLSGQTSEGLT